jgi:hypothetical protein
LNNVWCLLFLHWTYSCFPFFPAALNTMIHFFPAAVKLSDPFLFCSTEHCDSFPSLKHWTLYCPLFILV